MYNVLQFYRISCFHDFCDKYTTLDRKDVELKKSEFEKKLSFVWIGVIYYVNTFAGKLPITKTWKSLKILNPRLQPSLANGLNCILRMENRYELYSPNLSLFNPFF